VAQAERQIKEALEATQYLRPTHQPEAAGEAETAPQGAQTADRAAAAEHLPETETRHQRAHLQETTAARSARHPAGAGVAIQALVITVDSAWARLVERERPQALRDHRSPGRAVAAAVHILDSALEAREGQELEARVVARKAMPQAEHLTPEAEAAAEGLAMGAATEAAAAREWLFLKFQIHRVLVFLEALPNHHRHLAGLRFTPLQQHQQPLRR